MAFWDIFGRQEWPRADFTQIKKRSRLLVVDDREFPYLDLFERDGYLIDKWNDIEDLVKLESGYYDVILLDIQGVGTQQSAEQGLGILKHLRKVSPAQIILAYSNADWSLKYQDFFKLAEDTLDKGDDYVVFKRKVDESLSKRFSLDFYLSKIVDETRAEVGNIAELRKVAKKAILKGQRDSLRSFLEKRLDDPETIKKVLEYAGAAIEIMKIVKGLVSV